MVVAVAKKRGFHRRQVSRGSNRSGSGQRKSACCSLGKNVLAHVPNINDFVGGLKVLLKPKGTITMEFPHLMKLMAENQFDTIYHEHFSYLSLLAGNGSSGSMD